MTRSSDHLRPLFLVSLSLAPCGVETFARRLCEAWRERRGAGFGDNLAVSGVKDLGRIWDALETADALVVNFPVVAWKTALALPLLALLAALVRGKETLAVVHEWNDLNWLRRLFVSLYLIFARRLLFSSPAVLSQFAGSPLGRLRHGAVVVIPANMRRPDQPALTDWSARVQAEKRVGKLTLGHFGSIYPKKRSDFVLEIAAELKRRGEAVFVVFLGSFIKGADNVEQSFRNKTAALGLTEDVLVTGYVETDAEIFGILDGVDVFAYSFAEGLTSRRGSVLTCLQTGRPVVVNAPETEREFDHHGAFRQAIAKGLLRFVPTSAQISDYADAIEAATRSRSRRPEPLAIYADSWREAAQSLASAFEGKSTIQTTLLKPDLRQRP